MEDAFAEVRSSGLLNGGNDDEWAWMDDREALMCSSTTCTRRFWFMRRRHHCRPCGKVFCSGCCLVDSRGVRQCLNCKHEIVPESFNLLAPKPRRRNARARHMQQLVQSFGVPGNPEVPCDTIPLRKLISRGPPRKIFKPHRNVGIGAFGTVWCARDDRVGDDVAVKVLRHPDRSTDPHLAGRVLVREVVLWQRVIEKHEAKHSSDRLPFARLYDVFLQNPTMFKQKEIWISMEFIHGTTLTQFLLEEHPVPNSIPQRVSRAHSESALMMEEKDQQKRRQRSIQTVDLTEMSQPMGVPRRLDQRISVGIPEERKIADLARQILIAVDTIHDAGVVFRDLKADNVMIEHDHFADEGFVRIIDFGSCLELPNMVTQITENRLVGSLPYMAPEAWDFTYSTKSDVWAIGCLISELTTGNSPFAWVPGKVNEILLEIREREKSEGAPAETSAPVNAATLKAGTQNVCEQERLEKYTAMSELRMRMKAMLTSCEVFLAAGPEEAAQLPRTEELVSFVTTCFKTDPHDRPSCKTLLQHPFILRYTNGHTAAEGKTEEFYESLQNFEKKFDQIRIKESAG